MEELKYTVDDEVLIKGKVRHIYNDGKGIYPYRIEIEDVGAAKHPRVIDFADFNIAGKVNDQKTYEQGLNDAWEMAKLICMRVDDGGIDEVTICDIYEVDVHYEVLKKYSAQKTIYKYNAWKERNEIKMGDIVEYDIDERTICRAIFLYEGLTCYWVLTHDNEAPQQLTKAHFKLRKVGESGLDIAGALAKVREMED